MEGRRPIGHRIGSGMFPAMRASRFLRALERAPLEYAIVRQSDRIASCGRRTAIQSSASRSMIASSSARRSSARSLSTTLV